MTDAVVSQAGLVAVAEVQPEALVSQAGLIAVGEIQPVTLVSQAGLIAVADVQPVNRISQAGLIIVAGFNSCSTRRCQLWIIERTDGVTKRFTSHDVDVEWAGSTYLACGSLNETASEQSSDQGSVGNVELQGIIDSEHISDEDLYAGLYDDCFIQVWRVTWDDPTDRVFRIAAGWMGAASQGEQGFKGEVLGPGARLLQKPLLQTITPGCRFRFGDAATCGVDAEAMAIVGTVTAGPSRAYFYSDIIDPAISAQWDRGLVRFTYGRNTGQECEVREVDFTTGRIILWARSGFTPEPGDTFDLLPGCDLGFDGGCTVYANKLRFGGFPHVPGQDFVAQVPNAKA